MTRMTMMTMMAVVMMMMLCVFVVPIRSTSFIDYSLYKDLLNAREPLSSPSRPVISQPSVVGAFDPYALPWSSLAATYTPYEIMSFDTYTPKRALYTPPASPPLSSLSASYSTRFINNLIQNYFSLYYLGGRAPDFLTSITTINDFEPLGIWNNISYSLGYAYYLYRNNQGTALDIDSIDIRHMPYVNLSSIWLEQIYTLLFDNQIMVHGPVSLDQQSSTSCAPGWDAYGYLQNNIAWGKGVGQFLTWWQMGDYYTPLARFAYILPSDFLRTVRVHIMATMTAVYASSTACNTSTLYVQGWSDAQWTLKLLSFIMPTTVLLQTEKILKSRNEWSDSIDKVSVDDIPNGRWTNAYAVSLTESVVWHMANIVLTTGLTEFHSNYYALVLDSMARCMMHPSSQRVYEGCQAIYERIIYDQVTHFQPSAGQETGTTNRYWDLFQTARGTEGALVYRQFVQPFFRPYCDKGGTLKPNHPEYTCTSMTPSYQVPELPVDPFIWPWSEMCFALWQWAGYAYHPYSLIPQYLLSAPHRTVYQKFAFLIGNDRVHFITPYYSVSSAGDDNNMVGANYGVAIRLGGAPANNGLPTGKGAWKPYVYSVLDIRTMLTFSDNPFYRPDWDPIPGLNQQMTPRAIIAQYQSYMLLTSLASLLTGPAAAGTLTQPLASTITLPLAVDGLFVDSTPLCVSNGCAQAFPLSSIITVTHNGSATIIRPILIERSSTSPISDASVIMNIQPTSSSAATHPYACEWQVDADGWFTGAGKLTFAHKHPSDQVNRPYHVVMFIATGLARSPKELLSFQNSVRKMNVQTSITNDNGWNLQTNMFTGVHRAETSPDWTTPMGSSTLIASVDLPGNVYGSNPGGRLAVWRQDTYQPVCGSWPDWKIWDCTCPFYTHFNRTFNGQDTMLNIDSSKVADMMETHDECSLLQPHLLSPFPGCQSTVTNAPTNAATQSSAPTTAATTTTPPTPTTPTTTNPPTPTTSTAPTTTPSTTTSPPPTVTPSTAKTAAPTTAAPTTIKPTITTAPPPTSTSIPTTQLPSPTPTTPGVVAVTPTTHPSSVMPTVGGGGASTLVQYVRQDGNDFTLTVSYPNGCSGSNAVTQFTLTSLSSAPRILLTSFSVYVQGDRCPLTQDCSSPVCWSNVNTPSPMLTCSYPYISNRLIYLYVLYKSPSFSVRKQYPFPELWIPYTLSCGPSTTSSTPAASTTPTAATQKPSGTSTPIPTRTAIPSIVSTTPPRVVSTPTPTSPSSSHDSNLITQFSQDGYSYTLTVSYPNGCKIGANARTQFTLTSISSPPIVLSSFTAYIQAENCPLNQDCSVPVCWSSVNTPIATSTSLMCGYPYTGNRRIHMYLLYNSPRFSLRKQYPYPIGQWISYNLTCVSTATASTKKITTKEMDRLKEINRISTAKTDQVVTPSIREDVGISGYTWAGIAIVVSALLVSVGGWMLRVYRNAMERQQKEERGRVAYQEPSHSDSAMSVSIRTEYEKNVITSVNMEEAENTYTAAAPSTTMPVAIKSGSFDIPPGHTDLSSSMSIPRTYEEEEEEEEEIAEATVAGTAGEPGIQPSGEVSLSLPVPEFVTAITPPGTPRQRKKPQ